MERGWRWIGVLAVAGGMLAGVPAAHANHAGPLAGQWHLDEPCCSFADTSGHGLNGTGVGSPQSVPGRFGNALTFPTKNDYVNVGSRPELQPANVTLLAWVRADEPPANVKAIASQGASGSCSHSSYALYSGGSSVPAGLRFYIWNGSQAFITPPASNAMWDNAWHLVAGTYDGAAVRLYVDGAEVGSTAASGSIAYGLGVNDNFTIGNYGNPSECLESTQFNGHVDETRVYGRALSASEIARLAGHTGPDPPELVPDSGPPPPPPPPPDAQMTPTTLNPVTGRLMAFDPTASVARVGSIAKFAYDFDGSGRFDATCPPSVPVAYKRFDTPGTKVISMSAIDTLGSVSTTRLSLNVTGKTFARGAQAPSLLSNVKDFWCGDRASLPRLDLSYLPPIFTSEVRAVGIDLTQGVVPDPPRPNGLSLVSKALARSSQAGGIATQFVPLNNDKQDPARPENRIKWLRRGSKTIARVYASAVVSPLGDKVNDVQMRLYGFSGSRELPGSPLLSETGPLDVPHGPPFTTHAMRVGYDPIKGKLPAFTFTLPDSWSKGNLKLLAIPSLVGRRLDRQCSTIECSLQAQGRTEVLFQDTGVFFIRTVAMTNSGDAPLPSPSTVFADAFNLSPVGAFALPYQATLDISFIISCTATMTYPSPCTAADGTDASNATATAVIGQWQTDNAANQLDKLKHMTIGVHRGYAQLNGFASWPGSCANGPSGGAICATGTDAGVAQVNADRPLTSVAHEMFHGLGRPHADTSGDAGCGGNGEGKPDDRGHLQSIGLDRRPGSGGSLTEPYRLIAPGLPGGKTEWFDLMSYCANNNPDDDSWLSAYNWDTVGGEWISFLSKPLRAHFKANAAARGPALQVSGLTTGSRTQVTSVRPASGGETGPGNSPYRVLTRDAAGKVVGETPLNVSHGHLDVRRRGQVPTPVTLFNGVVPAAGAQALEVTASGQRVAAVSRSANRPAVRLLSPRSGTIGRGRNVRVRWRASDADRGPLVARVEYSANGGRSFRPVFLGPDKGSVVLPSRYFTRASNARLRVTANDGFNEGSATSGRLRAAGAAPAVSILNPVRNQRMLSDASLYLRGSAFDDALARLTGARLRWFVGRRLVGRGEAVTVSDLPPGRPRVRLLARDRRGRIGQASVRIRVGAASPFFTRFDAPRARLARGTRRVRLRVATNVSATLRAGGRRFSVGRRARTITVPVKLRGRQLRAALSLRARGRSAQRTLALPTR